MEKLYDRLHQLDGNDLRFFFYNLLKTVEHYQTNGSIEEKKLAEGLLTIVQNHIEAVHNHKRQIDELQQYVYLVFSLSDAGSLKVALSKIGKRELCQVLAFNELFSVGPITNLDTETGQQNRLVWLTENDENVSYNPEHQLDRIVEAVKNIPENKTIVIWCADNAHDQTGLRFVMHLLRDRKQPVNVVNVTELFNTIGNHNKEEFKPYWSSLIDREHFQIIVKKYYEGVPLDPSQRRRYESEWLMLSSENHVLRLWKERSVKGAEESALDEMIISSVIELEQEQDENGFINAGSVVARIFDTSHQFVGCPFITNRIWSLVNQGVLEFCGLPRALHQFSVKLGTRKKTIAP
ncbi:DUF1835 domain-containing protein [Paenibacillus sp. FSL H7-0756]|uniref:DUF1835 domain-containing protein n=1 Tax=Paenibacillus sp. FSL H7-0756 TaxID=2954738 RepID=UPI0030F4F48E